MKRKINISFWWLFWILYLEFIYRIFIVGNVFSLNGITVILFSLPWICIFTSITTSFSNNINKILSYIITFLITLFTLAQIVYFKFYDSVFSFFSLTTGTGQVMAFYEMIIRVIIHIWYIFILILIPLVLYFIFSNKNNIIYDKYTLKKKGNILIILSVSFLMIFFSIKIDKKETYSLNNLIYNTHAPMLTINKIGLNSMELIDACRYLFGFEEKVLIDDYNNQEYNSSEYNVYNIDFNKLIANEKNDITKMIHKYISNSTATKKNKYTGIFKDKNLIFITAESFDSISIDKNITPTLYKMMNNSYKFTNYYQPLYPISTSDGEYMNLNSLVPKEGEWSFSSSLDNDMKFAIGNMFKNNNYTANAYHNNDYKFYNRNLSHENIGFKFLGCGNGLEKIMDCNKWPSSDYDMMVSTIPYYINEDKFITYYMTVSGHLSYSYFQNNIAIKNKDLVENLEYTKPIRAFYATQIELDRALEYLINELEKANKLDDTIIVLCPDHFPYGLMKKELNIISDIDRTDKFENYHTSLIIYNPNIKKVQIDDTISGLDILPTLYNLFGIEYDSRLYMGKDIFSDTEHIVMLSDRSWITNKGKYDSITRKFYSSNGEKVSQEYIDKINREVYLKFTYSTLILDKDYYSKIGD